MPDISSFGAQYTPGQHGAQQGQQQQAPPGVKEGLPQGAWGGFDFQSTPTAGSGLGQSGLTGPQGIGSEAQFVLQGSSGAEAALRRGYEAMLREQAGGVANASQENERRTRASLTAGGISPLLAGIISRQRGQEAQGQYGEAVGGATSNFENTMAQLYKGTGSELAGIRQYDLGLLLKAKMGRDAAVAAEPSGLAQIAGVAAGGLGLASGLGWQPFK